jgi:peptidoglycan lytic transglycosylase D
MHYKLVLPAFLLVMAASSLRAQQTTTTVTKSGNSTVTTVVKVLKKKDTVVAPPPVAMAPATAPAAKPGSALLASNLPPAKGNTIAENKKNGYSHVPLAGEKDYFGNKNEYVNDFVRKYLELHNKTLGSVQTNSTKPFSLIDEVLTQKKLPKELKYLAVIESALNHNAVSHAGAVGPWQLMAETARMMGLSVNRRQDDRRDWAKSTSAATKYLELLYSQLNDWLLVIAAYNSGPTPVQRAIALTGSHNFWDIKQYLPRETQGHVLAFIATASIFENLSKFIDLGSLPVDFKFGNDEEPMPVAKAPAAVSSPIASAPGKATTAGSIPTAATPAAGKTAPVTAPATTVTVAKKAAFTDEELKNMAIMRIKDPIDIELMAQELNVDKKLLERWNNDYEMYTYGTYPTPYYNLRLPKDKVDVFMAKKEAMTKRTKIIFANKNI